MKHTLSHFEFSQRGGRVKGPSKARTSEQASKAALARWSKAKAKTKKESK